MIRKIKSIRSRFVVTVACTATALSLTACAIVPPAGTSIQQFILRDALMSPVFEIEDRASKGDANAAFALSVLYQYGLRGKPRDLATATQLRSTALAARGNTTITQYIPGLNGKPGRQSIINLPKADVSGDLVAATDACAAALAATFPDIQAITKCGGADSYAQLSRLWAGARGGL